MTESLRGPQTMTFFIGWDYHSRTYSKELVIKRKLAPLKPVSFTPDPSPRRKRRNHWPVKLAAAVLFVEFAYYSAKYVAHVNGAAPAAESALGFLAAYAVAGLVAR
jgi:hypothetical protein